MSAPDTKPLFLQFRVIGHAVAVDIRLPNIPEPVRATVDCDGPVSAMVLHQALCEARNLAVSNFARAMYFRGRSDSSESPIPVDFPCVL